MPSPASPRSRSPSRSPSSPPTATAHPPASAATALPSLATRVVHNQVAGAAVGVFTRLGFAATRVEDLIEAAGISRRTFYKYFDDKDAVLAAVYDLATTELIGAVRDAVAKAPHPLAGLHMGIDLYLDFHAQNAILLKVLVEHGFRSDSPLAPLRKRFRGELSALAVRAVAPRTSLDPYVYTALLSALEGLSLELLEAGTPDVKQVSRAKNVAHLVVDRVLGAGR